MKKVVALILAIFTLLSTNITSADAPFNNLEGVGGIAFNPVAYTAGSSSNELVKNISKPRFGAWYVHLGDLDVDWFATGVADTFFNRLELSYGYESIGQQNAATHNKNNIGAKFLVIPENFNDLQFVPAISLGAIYKHTNNILLGTNNTGWDGYLVATKLITQLPRPLLLSAGGLWTSSYATGAFGYDDDNKATFFANIDLFVTDFLVTGAEYKQGPDFSDFKNADYWDLHLAWLVNKNLSLILAYVNAGDYKSTSEVGLGNGVVLSAQYSF